MGENLSEVPKASLWVENLHGGNPLSLKEKKRKEKTKNLHLRLCGFYVCCFVGC